MKKQVIILGGGAAGLTAAIAASGKETAVTILEHGKKSAQKLLATGNGKCNLGNERLNAACYHCPDRDFVESVLKQWGTAQTMSFFTGLGIHIKSRNGYLYPQSEQAQAVRDVLLMEASFRKVKIKNNCQVEGIRKNQNQWLLDTPGWTYEADALILATGSPASNIPGADASGYALAKSLGHHIRKPLPALVPLLCKGVKTALWAGLRMEGYVSLLVDGVVIDEAYGELQMTDYGISAIPIFQLSGEAVRKLEEGSRVELLVDLFPGMTLEELSNLMDRRRAATPYKSEQELYVGLLPDKLIRMLPQENPLYWLKNLRLKVTGSRAERFAQVCSGGVTVQEIDPRTMQSRLHKNLYFAGEIMDVDGLCGGYNLHWAWATGNIAGRIIKERI